MPPKPPKPHKVHVKAHGAGYGAHIRSIDVDGQHFDLEKNSKPEAKPESVPEPAPGEPEQVQ
jgi:hypothetical protein